MNKLILFSISFFLASVIQVSFIPALSNSLRYVPILLVVGVFLILIKKIYLGLAWVLLSGLVLDWYHLIDPRGATVFYTLAGLLALYLSLRLLGSNQTYNFAFIIGLCMTFVTLLEGLSITVIDFFTKQTHTVVWSHLTAPLFWGIIYGVILIIIIHQIYFRFFKQKLLKL